MMIFNKINKITLGDSALKITCILIAALLFVIYNVEISKQIGRLSTCPQYDDCEYLLSGQKLINTIREHGVSGIKQFLNKEGLHCPYSTTIAAISLWVSKSNISSVYYANFLVIVLYLSGISYFIYAYKPLQFAALILLFLTPTALTMGVVEFRPDILWGIITGFTTVFIITEKEIYTSLKNSIISGFLLGIVLLVKPSTFALTLLVITSAFLSRILKISHNGNIKSKYAKVSIGVATIILVAGVIAGPYFYKFHEQIWEYFFDNCFGKNKDIWQTKIPLTESLTYYIFGPGSSDNLGFGGYELAGIFVFLILLECIYKKNNLLNPIILLISILCTVIVNAFSSMKGPFSGGVIYGLLFYGTAFLLGKQVVEFSNKRVCLLIFSILLLLGTFFYKWPLYSDWSKTGWNGNVYKKVNNEFNQFLSSKCGGIPQGILFMQTGPLRASGIAFLQATKKINIIYNSGSQFRDTNEFANSYLKFEWVILQDEGVDGSTPQMPVEKILNSCINMIKQSNNFYLLKSINSTADKHIYIYQRKQ